jgi:hypothetical protein
VNENGPDHQVDLERQMENKTKKQKKQKKAISIFLLMIDLFSTIFKRV